MHSADNDVLRSSPRLPEIPISSSKHPPYLLTRNDVRCAHVTLLPSSMLTSSTLEGRLESALAQCKRCEAGVAALDRVLLDSIEQHEELTKTLDALISTVERELATAVTLNTKNQQ